MIKRRKLFNQNLLYFSLKNYKKNCKHRKFSSFILGRHLATVPFDGTNCCFFSPENCCPLSTEDAPGSLISLKFHSGRRNKINFGK